MMVQSYFIVTISRTYTHYLFGNKVQRVRCKPASSAIVLPVWSCILEAGNLNKQHFFGLDDVREFSRSSQGRLSVKLSKKQRNEKRKNLNKTHFLREIFKSMHIKKVAKNIFFANSLAASVGYSCYKLLNNVAKVRSIYQKNSTV